MQVRRSEGTVVMQRCVYALEIYLFVFIVLFIYGGTPVMGQEQNDTQYKTQKFINGEKYDTYFFKTWYSYSHPIIPKGPISYTEIQKCDAYYEASYRTDLKEPQLIFFEKFFLQREDFKFPDNLTPKQVGEHYFIVNTGDGDNIVVEKKIDVKETIKHDNYVVILVDQECNLTKSELVKKQFGYSFKYIYDENGLLVKVIVKSSQKAPIQKTGKEIYKLF